MYKHGGTVRSIKFYFIDCHFSLQPTNYSLHQGVKDKYEMPIKEILQKMLKHKYFLV